MSAPAGLAPAEQAPTAATAALIGPDMAALWQRFPPRTSAPSWPATEQTREALLDRLLAPPFTVEQDRVARARRRLGLARLLGWLAEHPGDTWQQRWQASGADAVGNAEWWRPLLAWARPRNPDAGVSTSSNLRVCVLALAGADAIRPSLEWVLTPRAPQNLVAVMARARFGPRQRQDARRLTGCGRARSGGGCRRRRAAGAKPGLGRLGTGGGHPPDDQQREGCGARGTTTSALREKRRDTAPVLSARPRPRSRTRPSTHPPPTDDLVRPAAGM